MVARNSLASIQPMDWWEEEESLENFTISSHQSPPEAVSSSSSNAATVASSIGSGSLPPAIWEQIVKHIRDLRALGMLMCVSPFFAEKSEYGGTAIVSAGARLRVG